MPTAKNQSYDVKICRPISGTFFMCPLKQQVPILQKERKKGADWRTKYEVTREKKKLNGSIPLCFINSKILSYVEFDIKMIVWIGSIF